VVVHPFFYFVNLTKCKAMKVKALKKFLFKARMLEIGETVEMETINASHLADMGLVKILKSKRETKEEKFTEKKTKDAGN